jgi:hypothetical protein
MQDSTTTSCCVCCKEIPLDAAFTPEGAEYVEHFCGLECYQRFEARAKAENEPVLIRTPAARCRQIEHTLTGCQAGRAASSE